MGAEPQGWTTPRDWRRREVEITFPAVPREAMDVLLGNADAAPPRNSIAWEPEFVLVGVRDSEGKASIIRLEPNGLRARIEVEEARPWGFEPELLRRAGPMRYTLRADSFRMTFAQARTFGGALRALFGRSAHITVPEREETR